MDFLQSGRLVGQGYICKSDWRNEVAIQLILVCFCLVVSISDFCFLGWRFVMFTATTCAVQNTLKWTITWALAWSLQRVGLRHWLVVVPQIMSHNSQVTDLKAIRCRKTCNLCQLTHWSLHSSRNCSPFSNASHTYSRQKPRWKVMDEGMTNEGPCAHCSVVLLLLHPFVLFPAFLCVCLYWPSCVCGKRVDRPWALSGDG